MGTFTQMETSSRKAFHTLIVGLIVTALTFSLFVFDAPSASAMGPCWGVKTSNDVLETESTTSWGAVEYEFAEEMADKIRAFSGASSKKVYVVAKECTEIQ